jgi:hypothetical protein
MPVPAAKQAAFALRMMSVAVPDGTAWIEIGKTLRRIELQDHAGSGAFADGQ